MSRPPIIWLEPRDWVAPLRGQRYFRSLRFWNGGGPHGVQIIPGSPDGGEIEIQATRAAVFFRIMPAKPERFFETVVADVTADVLGLMPEYPPAMVAAHEAASTAVSTAFWSNPENLRGHAAALQSATLIMTSWAEMVDPLFEFADCPVVHVPDYHGRWGWAFRRGMRQVWRELEAATMIGEK